MTAAPAQSPAVTFAEIRQLLAALPPLTPVETRPELGRYGEWLGWLESVQGTAPQLRHPRLALFAGAHGCAAESSATTAAQVAALTAPGGQLLRAAESVDADLRVYELDLTTPTADFQKGPALTEAAAAHAMAYGMMAVEPGLHLICLAGFGAGGEVAYPALLKALQNSADPLETLAQHGGLEACAILGALVAARLAKKPVLIDGAAAGAAAATLAAITPHALLHTRLAAPATGLALPALLPDDFAAIPGLASALALGLLQPLT